MMKQLAQLLVFAVSVGGAAVAEETQEPWEWARTIEDEVWRALKTPVSDFQTNQREVEWSVLVIASDGFSRIGEYRLSKTYEQPVRAAYVRMVGQNLEVQLAELRQSSPDLTIAAAVGRLAVRRGTLTLAQCPGLARLARDVAALRIPVLPAGDLVLDPPGYNVTVMNGFSHAQRYRVGVGENALAKWCERLATAIQVCDSKQPGR